MKRPRNIRSDYELALLPLEAVDPDEAEWVRSKPDKYWVKVIERGEVDVFPLMAQIAERDDRIRELEWQWENLRSALARR